MLIHRKQGHKLDKPNRFNLGGLIKRKMLWRRSIDDSITSQDTYTVDCHELASQTAHYLLTASDAHYTHVSPAQDTYCAAAECILLQNSDMTCHSEEDPLCCREEVDQNEESLFDPKNEENISEYRVGGYCPVKIGDQFCSAKCRYKVLRKLGWGHFSTVWLALDLDGSFVALKVVKLGKNYAEAAADEIRILTSMDASPSVVALLDSFDVSTPLGTHVAMVFELMGENLLHLIYKKKAERYSLKMLEKPILPSVVPFPLVKLIVLQLLQSVDHMHRHGVIHTDIKPENVLMTYEGAIPDSVTAAKPMANFRILQLRPLAMSVEEMCLCPMTVKVADLGNATFCHNHFSDHIQTRQYRAPEVILRHKSWGASADVWLIGCLIFELITGDFLFDPHDGSNFTKDEDHMAQIVELLGEFPLATYLSQCSKASALFATPNSLHNIRQLKFWGLEDVFSEKYKFDRNDSEMLMVSDLIRKCLKYNLNERYDCASLMNHPWFSSDADYNKAAFESLPNRNNEILGFTREE